MAVDLVNIINGYVYGATSSCPLGGPSANATDPDRFTINPMDWNFSTLPAGTVGQPTQRILDIEGTPPFVVDFSVPPAYTQYVTIRRLPGGSLMFDATPPNLGAVDDVTIDIPLSGWNAHPDTNEQNQISQTISWLIHPQIVDIAWVTPTSLPDGEVGQPYAVYAEMDGTGPVTFTRQAGITTATLQTAGLNFTTGAISDTSLTPFLSGVPLPGSEGTLGSSLTVRAVGLNAVADDQVFGSGIVIRRKPGITITGLPVVLTTAGSVDLSQYLVGYPTASISRDTSSPAWPSGFSMASNTITWTGLDSANNGTVDMVFLLSNGYHQDQLVTFALTRNVPAASAISKDLFTSMQKSSASASTTTVSHAGASSGIKGVILAACSFGNTLDLSSCTYGGVNVPIKMLQDGSVRDTAVAFLGSGVPQGTQNAVFTWGSANTNQPSLFVITLLSDGDLAVGDIDGVNTQAANTSQQSVLGSALSKIFAFGAMSVSAVGDITDPSGVTRLYTLDQGTTCIYVWEKDTTTDVDYTFSLTHASIFRAFIQIAIKKATSQALPGALRSWSHNGLANTGTAFTGIANDVEILDISDLATGQSFVNKAQGTTFSAHDGGRKDATNDLLKFLDGVSGTLCSMGVSGSLGAPPYWIAMNINVSDTQVAGDRCFLTLAGTNFYLNRSGANSIVFKIKAGSATLSATAVDAVTNVVRLLFGVVDANTAYIAYATTGSSFTYDTGNQTVTGIGIAWTNFIFNPGSLGPANFSIQSVGWNTGLADKTAIASWLDSQATAITPPTPPPGVTAFRRVDALRWFSPELTWAQHGDAIRLGATPHELNANAGQSNQGQSGNRIIINNITRAQDRYTDSAGNVLILRTTKNSKPAFRHEVRKLWPTWYTGDTTSRARFLTGEYQANETFTFLRETKTYWIALSAMFSSEGDPSPWPPGIRQLILDCKQATNPKNAVGLAYNSMPRLELRPDGVIHWQALRLNAGQTVINPTGSNASVFTHWQQQLAADTWYDFVIQLRMACKQDSNPVMRVWLSVNGGQQTQVVNDTAPNSYDYRDASTGVANGNYTFFVTHIYDWDVTRGWPSGAVGGSWVSQVAYSGRFIVAEDGFGTPAPTAQNMLAALVALRA